MRILDDASALKATRVYDATCSRLSILPFATGPKRSMGHVRGGEKNIFFIRDIDDAAMASASVGILSIRGPEVSPGSLTVGTRHGQSPTPRARRLPSVHNISKFLCALLLWTMGVKLEIARASVLALVREPHGRVCRLSILLGT